MHPYTVNHTHTHTHTHSLRSQGLGRICAVMELLRSAFQGKGPAKATKPAKRYLVLVSHLPQLPATRQGSILPHRLADAAGRSTAVTASEEKGEFETYTHIYRRHFIWWHSHFSPEFHQLFVLFMVKDQVSLSVSLTIRQAELLIIYLKVANQFFLQ